MSLLTHTTNFHTKQAYLFHNWSIYYKLMLLLNLNTKLMTIKLLGRSYLVRTQFSYHSNTASPHCSQDVGTVRKKTYLTTKTAIYLERMIFLCWFSSNYNLTRTHVLECNTTFVVTVKKSNPWTLEKIKAGIKTLQNVRNVPPDDTGSHPVSNFNPQHTHSKDHKYQTKPHEFQPPPPQKTFLYMLFSNWFVLCCNLTWNFTQPPDI